MKYLKTLSVIFILLTFFISCSSSKQVVKKQDMPTKFRGTILSKDIEKQGSIVVPKEPASTFSTQDKEVVALLTIENLSGEHNIRWDWYDPNGNLYYSTGDFPIKISQGKYLEEVTPYHSLTLKGDKAAEMPGKWMTKIFIDNELIDTMNFNLKSMAPELLLPAGIARKPYPKDWGLIIAVEEYAHLPKVEFARRDGLIVQDYFVKVLGVPEENVIFLIDSDATKSRIEGYLKQYLPKNVQKDTTLYVYFVGHGAPDMKKGVPYLVPYDGDTLFIEQTGYELKQFYNDLDNLHIQRSYVFLDSCFSGVASRAEEMLTKGTRPALIHVQNEKLVGQKIVSFSSSSMSQASNAYPETEHGLFTYFLLRGLKGEADANDDGWISVKELYEYVSARVSKIARRLGVEQTPGILPSLDQIKDIAIGKVVR